MRIQDLLGKEFKGIKLKTLPLEHRKYVTYRLIRSLDHHKYVLEYKAFRILKELVAAGIAYGSSDPRWNLENSQSLWITFISGAKINGPYGSYYIQNTESNQTIIKIFQKMRDRVEYIKDTKDKLRRSLKGIKSATTRKRRGK